MWLEVELLELVSPVAALELLVTHRGTWTTLVGADLLGQGAIGRSQDVLCVARVQDEVRLSRTGGAGGPELRRNGKRHLQTSSQAGISSSPYSSFF